MSAGSQTTLRPIQARVFSTLLLLTAVTLLAVAAAFNLLIHGYVHNRVSIQLEAMQSGALRRLESHTDQTDKHGSGPHGRKLEDGFDRITGVRGSAFLLENDGTVQELLNSEPETAEELSAWFLTGHTTAGRKTVVLHDKTCIVSAEPAKSDACLVCYVDVTSIQAFTRKVNLVLFGIILAAIALSAVLSRRIARAFAEPVRSLSVFAGEIGQGNFQRKKFDFRDADFSRLADSMNRMADALREANRKQETFFQNVSHELRTPLTAIRGNAEGIVYGLMDPKSSGEIILSEADRLGGFVEDLLFLSRMGKSVPKEAAQPLDLRDVISLCVSEQRPEADRKGLVFTFDFDENPVLFAIRERDARQLFGNLISNAVRYAVKTVRLSCRRSASTVTTVVADDGPGIRPEDLPHIFERFYKGAGGKHGIGLSIAQAAANAYQGTVTAENQNGAVFTVVFPTGIS